MEDRPSVDSYDGLSVGEALGHKIGMNMGPDLEVSMISCNRVGDRLCVVAPLGCKFG